MRGFLTAAAACAGLAAVVLAGVSCGPGGVGSRQPLNILLVTADDLGLQLSSYGDTVIDTPNIDELAASGVQFEVAYVAQASCSPSRSAMFRGMYVHSNGQFGLTNASDFSLHPHLHDATLPNILRGAGYRTGILGKLHVDPEESFEWDYRPRVNGRDVAAMASLAGEFLVAERQGPFFLMVNFTDPHAYRERDPDTGAVTPYTFLDRFLGIPASPVEPSAATVLPFQRIDTPEQRRRVAGYYSEVLRVDAGVGMLLEELDASGREGDTVVIFTGDHGPPFDRGKTTVYEAGLRVPFLVRWPGVSEPGLSEAMVSAVDILPTVLDAAGIEPSSAVQGRSLRPVLGGAAATWREHLFAEFHMHGRPWYPRRAVRDGRYKLIRNLLAGEATPRPQIDGDIGFAASRSPAYDGTAVRQAFDILAEPPEYELYDLSEDPWEFRNVAGRPEHAAVQSRLSAALEDWRRRTEDPLLDPAFMDRMRLRVDGD